MKKLNEEQIAAIDFNDGPLLIIAGAGTGKTTVVTEKIKKLISSGVSPSQILALTFTEKAAREMEDRVTEALPYGYTQMWIMTFHSFGERVLREEGLSIGLDPKYKLFSETDATALIRKKLFEFDLNYFAPLGNPNKFIGGLLAHFSRLSDEDIIPRKYLSWAKSQMKINFKSEEGKIEAQKWMELAGAYKKYEEIKEKEGYVDFAGLITKTLELFRKRPNVCLHFRERFPHVLVDEFQDTNISQYELLKLLAPPHGKNKLSVVGDDSQSIYKFRGAAVSNILNFKEDYSDAKTVVLTKNYRSNQSILDSSYRLVSFNNPDTLESKLGISKKLEATRDGAGGVSFVHTDRAENEAQAVSEEIERLCRGEFDYSDIAILVRANNHAEAFSRALLRKGIPYQFLGPGRLFTTSEVVDLISVFRVIDDLDDNASFLRILSLPYFDLSGEDIVKFSNFARRKNLNLYDLAGDLSEVYISGESKKKISFIRDTIVGLLKKSRTESAGQVLYDFMEKTGYLQHLVNPDTALAQRRAENVAKFFDKLKNYELTHEDIGVSSVLDWIELSLDLGESPLATEVDWYENNAVNILTVHGSKGLEFSVVFLVNLVGQRFPSTDRREQIPIPEELIKEILPSGDAHIQEERRLFYVGMTRARDRLYLTASDYYGEGKRTKKISPFVFEALGDDALSAEQKPKISQLSFLDYQAKDEVETADRQKPHIDYLSYSQIETFRICPLHYKLSYIYKVFTPPTSSQSFGNSFHITLKNFYEEVARGKRPNISLLEKILEENWINEGYLNRAHEKRSLEKARGFLKIFLDKYYDSKIIPVAMEQPFTIKLANLSVGGKIDRIDERDNKLYVYDYKTGANALTQKEADNNLQLSIYALAAIKINEHPFNRKPEEVVLNLIYFDEPQIVTTRRTEEDLKKAESEILKYKEEIEKSDFKCSGNILCRDCEYRIFCAESQNS